MERKSSLKTSSSEKSAPFGSWSGWVEAAADIDGEEEPTNGECGLRIGEKPVYGLTAPNIGFNGLLLAIEGIKLAAFEANRDDVDTVGEDGKEPEEACWPWPEMDGTLEPIGCPFMIELVPNVNDPPIDCDPNDSSGRLLWNVGGITALAGPEYVAGAMEGDGGGSIGWVIGWKVINCCPGRIGPLTDGYCWL